MTYLTMKLTLSAIPLLLQTARAWTQWPNFGSLAQHESNLIIEELGPLLSEGAKVVSPSWPEAAPLLNRAAYPRISPHYAAIVQVKTEEDVQQTIKYANRRHIPFLAVSGGHGWLSTLNRLQVGIQINMRYLNHTRLHEDGKTVSVGGGTLQREVTAALFAKGKLAVTGVCDCVSVIGPLLGGGHSLLQERYGFAADNLVSAQVVLANGSMVTASADRNADLFWGLRGAGHNLGIVTGFDLRVHDDGRHGWTTAVLVFTHDKLEAFLGVWNELEDRYSDRGLLVMFAWVSRNDTVDGHRPIITMRIVSERDTPALADFLTAFRKLKPWQDSTSDLPWIEAQAAVLEPGSCSVNHNVMAFPNSFDRWDIAAMRRGFDLLADFVADDAFAGSKWMLESYGNKAVREVPLSENAVPAEERRYDFLTAFTAVWEGEDDHLLLKARDMGLGIQEASRSADEPHHVYLNYAQGSEALQQVYGADEERLARLKEVKRRYDPLNRFRFYMPL
ncbi:6-hydroxy-D-nicotine oxidase [Ophiocordyceps camponoti-floridani]|uniref:6-hydroxy-D-nicotine oxidase n=1 Tax=Ophiocordyceps camponoti-floridani TaxID=2030778 RepID=A0A8H4VG02_9HYPO|nr:6-hydroxy-D-nicotine oxidase [Ophiocordyceps camponoti-floridani]